MGFWDNVTPQSVESAKDGFKEFQIGDNEAVVRSAIEKVSESGNDMMVITFENDEGGTIKHFIVDGEFKQQKLKQFYIAFGIPFGNMNVDEWLGKRGIVVCKQGKPNNTGNVYNQVSYLRPLLGASTNHQPSQAFQQSIQPPASEVYPEGEFTDDIPF